MSFEARYLLNVCRYGRFRLKVERLNPGDVLLLLLALSTKYKPIQVTKAQTECFLFSEQKVFFFIYLAFTWTAQPNSSSRSFLISSRLCSVGIFCFVFLNKKKVTIWNKTYLIRAAGAAGMDLRGNEHEPVNLGQSSNITSHSSYQTDRVQLNLSGFRKSDRCRCCQTFKTSVGRKFHLFLLQ